MMYIDHNVIYPGISHPHQRALQHGHPPYLHQRFGDGICNRSQTRADARRKYHAFDFHC